MRIKHLREIQQGVTDLAWAACANPLHGRWSVTDVCRRRARRLRARRRAGARCGSALGQTRATGRIPRPSVACRSRHSSHLSHELPTLTSGSLGPNQKRSTNPRTRRKAPSCQRMRPEPAGLSTVLCAVQSTTAPNKKLSRPAGGTGESPDQSRARISTNRWPKRRSPKRGRRSIAVEKHWLPKVLNHSA